MKNFIVCLLVLIFLTSCVKNTKKDNAMQYDDPYINSIDNNEGYDRYSYEQMTNPVKTVNASGYSIENISNYIFNDLKLNWDYRNLNDILLVLNIIENYTINEYKIDNYIQTHEGFFDVYEIESDKYKIVLYLFSGNTEYWLKQIKIEINEENYLQLFPYINMDKYIEDEKFGKISNRGMEENKLFYYLRYGEDDSLGYSELEFNNGILKSITLILHFS